MLTILIIVIILFILFGRGNNRPRGGERSQTVRKGPDREVCRYCGMPCRECSRRDRSCTAEKNHMRSGAFRTACGFLFGRRIYFFTEVVALM